MSDKQVAGDDVRNAIPPEVMTKAVSDIRALQRNELTEKSLYMTKRKEIRNKIKLVKDDARDSGIPLDVLDANLEILDLKGKIETAKGSVAMERREFSEYMEEVLDDFASTGLGKAAIAKAAALDEAEKEPPRPRGRPKGSTNKKKGEPETSAASSDPLGSLTGNDDKDLRSPDQIRREAERIAESTARIQEGIRPLSAAE